MNVLVICAILCILIGILAIVMPKHIQRFRRIKKAKLRAANRQQLQESIKSSALDAGSHSPLVNTRKDVVQPLLVSKDAIIAKLLADNPDLAIDVEFIEIWANTEPHKL